MFTNSSRFTLFSRVLINIYNFYSLLTNMGINSIIKYYNKRIVYRRIGLYNRFCNSIRLCDDLFFQLIQKKI